MELSASTAGGFYAVVIKSALPMGELGIEHIPLPTTKSDSEPVKEPICAEPYANGSVAIIYSQDEGGNRTERPERYARTLARYLCWNFMGCVVSVDTRVYSVHPESLHGYEVPEEVLSLPELEATA